MPDPNTGPSPLLVARRHLDAEDAIDRARWQQLTQSAIPERFDYVNSLQRAIRDQATLDSHGKPGRSNTHD